MAAALASRIFRAGGRSLLGGLKNDLAGSMISSNGMMNESILLSQILPFVTVNKQQQQRRIFIQMGTVLKVVDNSGAKKVMCIQALKRKKGARLGDTIVASVKEAMPNGKVKKGALYTHSISRVDGSEVSGVFGPVPHELRKKKHLKILALAQHIA
ncbi:hypothetical protein HID58_076249 [Brassica napus]|uniref:Ribosomal protein L14 n=1 Tax=Brassica napus TaxID=3708 RepID=A0ABQ7YM95_BRANA|nr:hypothetical protein HID58_076249 [Brassica napus]